MIRLWVTILRSRPQQKVRTAFPAVCAELGVIDNPDQINQTGTILVSEQSAEFVLGFHTRFWKLQNDREDPAQN